MRAFAQAERFVSELESRKLRPAYVFVGDEAFFRKRFRDAILEHLVPADLRDFSLFEFDLAENDLAEVLDRARTPSLMAPFQVFFVRGVKNLFGRGSNEEKLVAIEEYCKNPNPDALIVFVADHISIPADVRRMEMQDKERYQRIRETMGQYCGIVELARVEEGEAVRWISEYCASRLTPVKMDPDGVRELVDALGGDMMMISNELEKLMLYVGARNRITLGDVETMVLAAKQRSLYELTDAISAKDRVRALEVLDAILSSGEGEEAAIGHIYMLAKTFRQMLVILERNVRDQRMLWAALWQGFRVPPFAADDIIKQARRYKSRRDLARAIRLVAKADLALRSNPVSKRMVLERLVIDLTTEPKVETPGWMQEQLPV
ncbi:MAG TPA: DNA polymerase III subunit delta [Candidatus Dormibacteraeota bacterium]|jgi:DNA polymerase-3 subunit delta|nr:DNA polymerase III subunit delta [Candidatus Dormibacteraeota bacterium]